MTFVSRTCADCGKTFTVDEDKFFNRVRLCPPCYKVRENNSTYEGDDFYD